MADIETVDARVCKENNELHEIPNVTNIPIETRPEIVTVDYALA